ncbi:unnamed protein product [Paramecium primaurelia]|uniref:Uncharacterized protein n=1 Tax=Paramecium primaurelia TaxID=5886 RepID=A0A8S1K3K7_PARPR|nr:unnamed protein product [Paramecium primaurelia]
MGKPLTAELIVQKTKNDQLFQIKNLNLWGNDIDDLKALRQLPNLEVLSLSVNKISTLKDIGCCQKLQELYLRKNCVSDIKELRYLVHLPNLRVLWLQDNPCADHPNYREIVVKYLPNLVKLDNTTITNEDRQNAQSVNILEDDFEEQTQNNNNLNRPKSSLKESPKKQPFIFNQQEQQRPATPEINSNQQNILNNNKNIERNENILCAVLSLIKELDDGSLEVVKKDIDRKLQKNNLKRIL